MVHQIAEVIPGSFSVSLGKRTFYGFGYGATSPVGADPISRFRRAFGGALLLGKLAVLAEGIFYVGPRGFLHDDADQREFEFRFLKSHGLRIAICWCGSDIRSTKLMHELEEDMGIPNIFTYIGEIEPSFESDLYESWVRERARLSDLYADIVFTNPTDHKSYIKNHTEPFLYLMPDEKFEFETDKFADLSQIVVTHAATSPIIKGTPLVRAAIAQLRAEGYQFEYTEMFRATNEELLDQLRRSHISLNQFYGFNPAVFGVESMAMRCAVLQSSDSTVETTLAPGANDAWIVTKHFELYNALKKLLDDPESIEPQALRGQEWAMQYASASSAGSILRELLNSVLAGTYDLDARSKLTNDQVWEHSALPSTHSKGTN